MKKLCKVSLYKTNRSLLGTKYWFRLTPLDGSQQLDFVYHVPISSKPHQLIKDLAHLHKEQKWMDFYFKEIRGQLMIQSIEESHDKATEN